MRDDPPGVAPSVVQRHAHDFFDHARRLLGDRFAEARFDADRGLRVSVIDLNDRDIVAIADATERLGIAGWVRTERADPVALSTWERLRHDLLRLEQAEPRVLQQYPTPEPGYRRPPVRIDLAAFAETTATDLYAGYGEFVSLRVGALPYPPAKHPSGNQPTSSPTTDRAAVNSAEMRLALDGPLTVRSGHTTTHGLLLTNLTDRDIRVSTDGDITATISDDAGRTVGGFAGAHASPLVIYTAKPSETLRIPLLVGTASFEPELGYRIPPGKWRLHAPLDLADGRQLQSAALELTITE